MLLNFLRIFIASFKLCKMRLLLGWSIFENINLVYEMAHDRVGWQFLIVGMAKAHDRVDWQFLITILKTFDFSDKVCTRIFECVETP